MSVWVLECRLAGVGGGVQDFGKRLALCQRMDGGIVFWSALLKITRFFFPPGKKCTEDFSVLSPGSDDGLHPSAAAAAQACWSQRSSYDECPRNTSQIKTVPALNRKCALFCSGASNHHGPSACFVLNSQPGILRQSKTGCSFSVNSSQFCFLEFGAHFNGSELFY